MLKNILICILAYLVGSINPTFILGKIKGFDVRNKGSHNAGASNALIVMGKGVGVACMFFDIFKAFGMVKLAYHFEMDAVWVAATMTLVILGHMFPFYMKFRGGKGLACLGGSILGYDWKLFLIMLAAVLVIVLITDYICFAPVSASIAFTIIYGIQTKSVIGALILSISAAAIFCRHINNFKKIKAGVEVRFSYLWNKDKEIDRITKGGKNA